MGRSASPFALGPVARVPLSVVVARRLRDAIVGGELAPGTELPSEKELGARLGVGRSTLREALRILQAQGLLSGAERVSTQRPRVVDDRAIDSAALALDSVLRLGKVSLADLVELRVVLEGAAVEAAARALQPAKLEPAKLEFASLELARAALEAMRRADDIEDFCVADLQFHTALARASGNAAYPLVLMTLRQAVSRFLDERLQRAPSPRAIFESLNQEHEHLLCAVEGAQPDQARALVAAHIRDFYLDPSNSP